MKKIVGLLLLRLFLFVPAGHADNIDTYPYGFDEMQEVDLKKSKVHLILKKGNIQKVQSLRRTFGFATYAGHDVPFSLPSSEQQVFLKNLPISSRGTSLSQGGLKLEKGVYLISYGANLQNTQGEGSIITWLSMKPSHSKSVTAIPLTYAMTSIFAPGSFAFSPVQVSQLNIVTIETTSTVFLNYVIEGNVDITKGIAFLADCSCRCSSSEENFHKRPIPFSLVAVKVADIMD